MQREMPQEFQELAHRSVHPSTFWRGSAARLLQERVPVDEESESALSYTPTHTCLYINVCEK